MGSDMEVIEGVGVRISFGGVIGGAGSVIEVGGSFQKRGQTALSTEDVLWPFAELWIGDRVVSPLF